MPTPTKHTAAHPIAITAVQAISPGAERSPPLLRTKIGKATTSESGARRRATIKPVASAVDDRREPAEDSAEVADDAWHQVRSDEGSATGNNRPTAMNTPRANVDRP